MASAMSVTCSSSKHSRRALGGDQVGGRDDRVVALVLAEARLALGRVALAPGVDVGVDLGHEGVEVDAALLGDRGAVEEQVHQHGLAAPDRSPQIDAALALGLAAEQREAGLAGVVQIGLQPRQGVDGGGLGHVGLDLALGQALAIGGADGCRHRDVRLAREGRQGKPAHASTPKPP
jgi:hypothetical protein